MLSNKKVKGKNKNMSYYKEAVKRKFADYEIEFTEHDNFFITEIRGNNAPNIRIGIDFSSNTENLIQIASNDFIYVRNKKQEVLEFLNQKHLEYRWFVFSIDGDGGVRCSTDTYLSKENAEHEFATLFVKMIQIVDEFYPELMKIVWG